MVVGEHRNQKDKATAEVAIMATAYCWFEEYYAHAADPYGATPEVLQDTHAPVMANTPTLFGATVSTSYPLMFLASTTGGIIYPLVAPFDQSVLPGQGTPRKYALIGGITPQGILPPIVLEILGEFFHLTPNQAVPAIIDMTNRWIAQPGDHYLNAEIDGVQGAETVRTRYIVPVPHRSHTSMLPLYSEPTIKAH